MPVTALTHWTAHSFWSVYTYNERDNLFSFASINILAEADMLVRSGVLAEIVYLAAIAYGIPALRFSNLMTADILAKAR